MRIAEQCLGQPQALAHALGIGLDPPVDGMGQPDLFQQIIGLLAGGALDAGKVMQGLATGQLRIEHHVFRQIAELATYFRRVRRAAQHLHLTFGRSEQAEDEFHGGGLAGAIVAEQPQHLARLQLQIQLAQRGHLAVTLADAANFNRIHQWDSCVR